MSGIIILYVRNHYSIRQESLFHTSEIIIPYVRNHYSIRQKSLFHTSEIIIPYVRNHYSIRQKSLFYTLGISILYVRNQRNNPGCLPVMLALVRDTLAFQSTASPSSVALVLPVMVTMTRSPMWWRPLPNTTALFCSVRPMSCSRERLLKPSTSTS